MAIMLANTFLALALQCAPSIHPATLTPIVKTESSFNPYAIGVVGKALPRQPQSRDEAVTAVKKLVEEGANFSIGLGQINRQHFDVSKPELVFDPCTNLRMTAKLLEGCYANAKQGNGSQQDALHKTISCYYSGNTKRGFKTEPQFGGTSHVQRVLANANSTEIKVPALNPSIAADSPGAPASAADALIPSYESWDVLRQYPRFITPSPKKSAPVSKQQDASIDDTESLDDQ